MTIQKKKLPIDDEIDFFELFKTIWDGKIIIIFAVVISIAVSSFINSQKQQVYNISLKIKPAKVSEINNFLLVTSFINNNENLLNLKTNSIKFNDIEIYNIFINQITDFEFLKIILKKNEIIKKSISQLSEKNKEYALYNHFQKIQISQIKENEHIINFNWHNEEEGKEILTQVINFTKKNHAKSIFIKLNNGLDLIKNIHERTNLSRIEYLLEQRDLAKELNISENSVKIFDSENNIAYYLRGYKAIEKEISLIRNRDFQNIKDVKKTISSLELNDQIKWINFNIYSMDVKSINNFKGQQILSIIIGLILGLSYIFVSRAYNLYRKKKN